MRRFRRAFAALASVSMAVSMAIGVGVSVAHAATPSILQVDDNSANCTDTGSGAGSYATPFCTIQAAANAVIAGGSVVIAPGTYAGAVDIRSTGTAAAPITILISGLGPVRISDGPGQSGPALTFDGASYVNFYGQLALASPWRSSAPGLSVASVQVNASSHVTLDAFDVTNTAADFAVEMTGSSSGVSLLHSTLSGPHGGVLVAAGDSGDVITTNQITSQASGIEVDGASNTAITSNTLWGQSAAGHQIDVTGDATGTAIKDNLVTYPGTVAGPGAAISVDPTSAADTSEDYNLVWPDQRGTSTVLEPAYSWAGASYASQAAFNRATNQGKHDLVADPQLQAGSPFTDHATAPQFNSADYTATGWQSWDLYGHTCQGDPYAPVTGNGAETDCERGAVQQAFEAVAGESAKAVGPLGVALTSSVTGETELEDSWINVQPAPTPAVSYVIDWGDGTTSAPLPGSVNIDTTTMHTYAKPGTYTVKETIDYTMDHDFQSTPFTTTALGAGILYHEERFADQHWNTPNTLAGSSGILQAAITGMPDESSQYVAVAAAGTLEHGVSSATGVWSGWGTLSQPGITVEDASIAGMPNGSSQVIEVTSGGALKHTIRNANGTWQAWASPAGSTGITQAAITAMPNGDSQLVATTTTGALEHDIRYANGTWQGWRALSQPGVTLVSASIAGMPNGSIQIAEVISGGALKHTIRNANGTWQAWASPAGSTSITQAAITGMPDGSAQLVAVTATGALEHDIRYANGTWQGWATPGQTDLVAAVADAGIAALPDGDAQIIELSAN